MIIEYHNNKINIKNYPQYEAIPYHRSFRCNCGYSRYEDRKTFNVIGYTCTHEGYMAVFECEKCCEVYRHHITRERNNLDEFKNHLAMILNLKTLI